MTTINITLPDKMKEFVSVQVETGNFGTVSEYVKNLIRMDFERLKTERLDALLLEGLKSIDEEGTVEVDDEYWKRLHQRINARQFRRRQDITGITETKPAE